MSSSAYSSPNSMVWEYLNLLRRIVWNIHNVTDDHERRQDIALSILLGVTVVETFINIHFRILVSEEAYNQHESFVLDCLAKRKSLEFKLREWPKKIFSQDIKFNSGIGKRFSELKDLRNKLMHFTTSHDTIEFGGIKIKAVSDTGFYNDLTEQDATNTLETTESFIAEVLSLDGRTEQDLIGAMIHWTGNPHFRRE